MTNARSPKQYDRAYFDRWYRNPRTRVTSEEPLARKVHLAVSAAEYMLGRPIERVLDVGCGEARWRTPLMRMRKGLEYIGVDGSEYSVRRYGRRRNIRLGTFGGLASLKLRGRFDLIVCADMLQYVTTPDVARGLKEIARLLGGVAFIEAYAREDSMEGDRDGWHDRGEREYRKLFRDAGLTSCGLYCWVNESVLDNVNALERAE